MKTPEKNHSIPFPTQVPGFGVDPERSPEARGRHLHPQRRASGRHGRHGPARAGEDRWRGGSGGVEFGGFVKDFWVMWV